MKQQIDVRVAARVPADRVWALLTDVRGWSAWGPFDEATLERPGSGIPDGVGAIRRFRLGRTTSREEVVAFEPDAHFAYVLLSGCRSRATAPT